MRRACESALCYSIVFFPECATHIPVGKPHLFCFKILGFHIEDACMSKQGCKSVVMVAGKPIDGESAVGCSGGSDALIVYIWILLHVINSREIVAHVLSGIITGDLSIPFCAETREPSTVGCYHYVSFGCHEGKVPACAPELAHSLLRTSLAVKNCGISLGGIEVCRIKCPYQHLFAIGGRYHLFLYSRHLEGGKKLGIDICETFYLSVGNAHYLVGIGHCMLT